MSENFRQLPADAKILITGGAGLVGQNLVLQLIQAGYRNLEVLDKHHANLNIFRQLHPQLLAHEVDLSEAGRWSEHFKGAQAVVMLQAQIGGLEERPFIENNVVATERILEASVAGDVPYIVHASSSVVESVADDHYTRTKRQQEQLVKQSRIAHVILRPTLMFGWFDRKHLGWLARMMRRVPVFPIPGSGRYMRQPLYAADFCRIIVSCLQSARAGETFNISGFERIDYIDIIREIRRAIRARCMITRIPVPLFEKLLQCWALFDKDPPFTAAQLRALIAHDEFEVIDWPKIFDIQATPLRQAIDETLNDPRYSNIVLDF